MHQAVVEVGTDICADVDEAFTDVAMLTKNHQRYCGFTGIFNGRFRHTSLQPLGKPADHRSCSL